MALAPASSVPDGSTLLPGVVSGFDPRARPNSLAPGANVAFGVRCVVPRSGVLKALSVFIADVSDGNIDVGVYSPAATRVALYRTGAIACPPTSTWTNVGDPNIPVRAGEQVELVCSVSSATVTFGVLASWPGSGELPAAYTLGVAAAPKVQWTAAAAHPLPASFAEGDLSSNRTSWAIIALVA